MSRLLAGADPVSHRDGAHGALLLHGFIGQPRSMRPLATAFVAAGFAVEVPRLPGHGTCVADLVDKRFDDFAGAAAAHYDDLAQRCDRTVVGGLSMGGTLACWLAERRPSVAGLVLINPLIEPTTDENMVLLREAIAEGNETFASIGSDINRPGVASGGYEETPLAPLLSLLEAVPAVRDALSEITAPVLVLSSRDDHVVPCATSDTIVERVAGPVERHFLERSFHVATLDFDADEIESRAVAFGKKVVEV